MAETAEYGGKTKRQWLDEQRMAMRADRSQYEPIWHATGDAILPFRPRFNLTQNNAPRLSTSIINGTATQALRRLRATIQAELMSPASDWYELTTGDQVLDATKEVAVWLTGEKKAQQANLDQSNAYTEADLAVGDTIVFATGALFMEESLETVIHCTALPIGSYSIGLDQGGRVNRIVRDFRLSTSQMVEKFAPVVGGKRDVSMLPLDVRNAYRERRMLVQFDVAHMIYPNDDWNPYDPGRSKQFSECYWSLCGENEKNGGLLREGGYDEFPVMVPRWEVAAGDIYGTNCPAIEAIGDILELQELARDRLRLVALLRKPPLVTPAGIRSNAAELLPGGLNEEDGNSKGITRPLLQVNPQALQALLEAIQDKEGKVREAFYADLAAPNLDNQRTQPDTAAAVYAKRDERNTLLGPVVTRWDDDFSDPFIARLFGIRWRAGLVTPPPPILRGKRIRVRLTSKLAKAQYSVGLAAEERLDQTVLQIAAQGVPQVLDVLAWDKRIRLRGILLGADPTGLNDDKETAAIRTMRAQAQQQAAVAAQQQQAADTAAKLSKVDMNKDTAATRLVSGAR